MTTPDKPKNAAAVALGRMAKGKRKTLSAQERERRRASLAAVREKSPNFLKRAQKETEKL